MNSSSLLSALWIFTLAANALAVLRLYRLSLVGRYRYFFTYLLVQLAQASLLFFLDIRAPAFFWTYIFTQPALWILYVLLVRELYTLIFEDYQGIYTVGRWSMYAAYAVSLCISGVTIFLTAHSDHPGSHVYYFEATERGVVFSLALFLPLALFFLSRYPIRLHRNIVVHSIVYSALFLADAVGLLLLNVAQFGINRAANLLLIAISGCCYLAWAALLTRESETGNVVMRHRRSPAHETLLLQELYSMNQTLLSVIRK